MESMNKAQANIKKGEKVYWAEPDKGHSSGMYKVLRDNTNIFKNPILIGNGSSEAEVPFHKLEFEEKVVFRKFSDGDIIALLPNSLDTNYTIASYMHVGQHSGADYDHVISKTKPAKESEYADLLNELVRVGYTNLRIMKKCRPKFS